MQIHVFEGLPDEAQLWIYGFKQPLTDQEKNLIQGQLREFLEDWTSHGRPVTGKSVIYQNQFVFLAGWSPAGISGCSIDQSVRLFKQLKTDHDLDALDRTQVFFRDRHSRIQTVPYQDFQSLLDNGEVHSRSTVFDTTLQKLAELRRGDFELPLERSWHSRTFQTSV